MSTEELKIIMDALVQLGEAGKAGFIWWLFLKYGMHYLTVITFIVAAGIVVRSVIAKLTSVTHGNQLGQELSLLLNTSQSSYQGWESESYRGATKAEIINKVRELMAAKSK